MRPNFCGLRAAFRGPEPIKRGDRRRRRTAGRIKCGGGNGGDATPGQMPGKPARKRLRVSCRRRCTQALISRTPWPQRKANAAERVLCAHLYSVSEGPVRLKAPPHRPARHPAPVFSPAAHRTRGRWPGRSVPGLWKRKHREAAQIAHQDSLPVSHQLQRLHVPHSRSLRPFCWEAFTISRTFPFAATG